MQRWRLIERTILLFFQELLTTAVDQGYQLTDYEANSFLPYLLIKVGLLSAMILLVSLAAGAHNLASSSQGRRQD